MIRGRTLPPTLEWKGDASGWLELIDQTLLPTKLAVLRVRDVDTLWEAIRSLRVRGAPAIGVAAAFGVLLGARAGKARAREGQLALVDRAARRLATSRPTAVNLFWALERMQATARRLAGESGEPFDREGFLEALLAEARKIHDEDAALCAAIGRQGARLLGRRARVLTHCNAGALATGGSGTALSVIYAARDQGKQVSVVADETRPLLQGARLTAWELARAGVEVTLICDNMAATVLREGKISCVIVGADRIAANGDVANKIGTYGVAVLARAHDVPFYVAAPSTTFDLSLSSGAGIPIEERSSEEITEGLGRRTAPRGVRAYNPAFDVTPARLVSAIITERGIARPPYSRSLARLLRRSS